THTDQRHGDRLVGHGDRMMPRGLAAGLAMAAAASVPAAGCKNPAMEDPAPAPVAGPAPPASAVPADHLAPDELVEGERTAFQLRLPRDLKVDGAFSDVVFASGFVAVHPLVKYFRARLADGSLREGEDAATFDHVHVPGKSTDDYTLRITRFGSSTRVEFRDVTSREPPNLPDDAARWRQAGLTPKGRVLDPKRFE
ncbi:MAG: hypothetical protein ACRENE_28940, partial [Polyangiaceae bacterium]